MKQVTGGVCAAQGFSAAGIHCGSRRNQSKRDLALIYSAVPASAAAVYTSNLVKGAPLTEKSNIQAGDELIVTKQEATLEVRITKVETWQE